MKRKLLSLILVVAMLASMAVFTPTASAAESKATLAFGNAAGVAGDEVTVELTVTTDKLDGIQFVFEYDTARLTYEDITWTNEFGTGFPADLTNGDNKVFTSVGPYKILSWGKPIGSNPTAAEGVVMATLTFTINEDAPAGDAYVKFAPLGEGAYQPNKINDDILAADMTFVDGVVTVLPEGYSTESQAPVVHELTWEDGSFEYNDDFTGVYMTSYTGSYDGILYIGEVDNGEVALPVIAIYSLAFQNNTALQGVILSEAVAEVDAAAFYRCSITDYYVQNPDCVLGSGALGVHGTFSVEKQWNAGGNDTAFGPYVNVVGGKPVTIHGAAGSTAEAYATATYLTTATYTSASFGWVVGTELVGEATVTVNGNTYYVTEGATVAAPGVAVVDGKTVIGWTAGDVTYAAGADMTVTESVVLEPVTITAPATSTVADFKLAASEADLAMRFTSSMAIADYEALAALGTVELGMLITPAAYVAKAGSFTKEALDGIGAANGAYVEVAVNGYYDKTETDYIFAGSLKGFSATTLAKNPAFASVLYATVTTAEGDTFTVYGTFNFAANQQVKAVAEAILDTNITNTQKGWLNTLIGKFGA